jgi:hypothetical protein
MQLRADTAKLDATGCELAAEVLRTYGSLRLGVTGWSMFPAILPGDVICVERASFDRVSEGDVVLFHRDGRLFAHRAVRTAGDAIDSGVLTRGDAMRSADAPVTESELLGRVTSIDRNGRCIDARKNPRFLERAISTLIQRSEVASRVAVGIHGFRASSRVQPT